MANLLLLLIASWLSLCIWTICARPCTNIAAPPTLATQRAVLNLDNYPLNLTLWTDSAYLFTFYWRAETAPCADGLRVALVLQSLPGQSLDAQTWAGLGFGDFMLDPSTFFVVMKGAPPASTGVTLTEYKSRAAYKPPMPSSSINPFMRPVSAGSDQQADGTQSLFSEFWIPANVTDGYHPNINLHASQPFVFAFQPAPDSANDGFSFHDQYRGHVLVHSLTGSNVGFMQLVQASRIDASVESTFKALHAWGMLTAWFLLLPLGIFYARYFRSSTGWLLAHLSIQAAALALIILCFVIILVTIQLWSQVHARIGVALIVIMLIQATLGVCKFYCLRTGRMIRFDKCMKLGHHVVGPLAMALACYQTYLGLQTLVPWSEPRGKGMWYYWFVLLGLWIPVFISFEIWYTLQQTNDPRRWMNEAAKLWNSVGHPFGASRKSSSGSESALGVMATKDVQRHNSVHSLQTLTTEPALARLNIPVNISLQEKSLKSFTWETLDEAVNEGNLYVVANGRYVFDLNEWRFSHPGGSSIFEQVAGTDITFDFFASAGYDVAEFSFRVERADTRESPQLPAAPAIAPISPAPGGSAGSYNFPAQIPAALSSLTRKDWEMIQSTRKPHVHTRLAIKRLSSMIVGEMSPSAPHRVIVPPSPYRAFSPYEYVRYAVTHVVRIVATASKNTTLASTRPSTPTPSVSNLQNHKNGPVIKSDGETWYRVRFARLYPFDRREGEPKELMVGSRMEIQFSIAGSTSNSSLNVSNGESIRQQVSRWLTPIRGDLIAFEVLIKVMKNAMGPLANLIKTLKAGKRQFKMRGPFGTPLVHPSRPLSMTQSSSWIPDEMVFIVAGSGVLCFCQYVEYQVFRVGLPLKIHASFQPRHPDELELDPLIHTQVTVTQFMGDGWAHGFLSHQKKMSGTTDAGYFPVSHTWPPLRSRIKLLYTVRHISDVAAMTTIKALGLSYPWLLQSTIHVTDTTSGPRTSTSSASSDSSVYQTEFGEIHPHSRVTEETLSQYLHELRASSEQAKRRIVIAGPESFCAMAYSTCTAFGFDCSDLVLYSPGTVT
ncbi:hypothetical protein SeLEV6574_g03153 [Synchytrium endobioticum]|uniref:Cytochrome b5 heme-binding domain-containing protein n=1 Tax=Synchytrium endobioticum TaxID=286115 RepID=A0A507D5M2_9FUNG|nr:hypothetical protein SeLEV6574_g03146 [Synchytrium endobioticum]TPX46587.1 hypothetical protein SeLEV6574_g03153 [Synchytrium endobioticum]